jgi:hypothetical protein
MPAADTSGWSKQLLSVSELANWRILMNENYADWLVELDKRKAEERAGVQRRKAELLARLAALGVATLEAEYDCAGDSGAIDYHWCYGQAGEEVTIPDEDAERVVDFLSRCLGAYRGGCEINEGCYGTATILVAEARVEFEHKRREVSDDPFEV